MGGLRTAVISDIKKKNVHVTKHFCSRNSIILNRSNIIAKSFIHDINVIVSSILQLQVLCPHAVRFFMLFLC